MNCPYCGKPAEWCENKEIYGRRFGSSYMCYLCRGCDAYVGCHENTKRPLGTMANAELRTWRRKAHAVIDPYWKGKAKHERGRIYGMLRRHFGKEIHVGESDVEQCKKIIDYFTKPVVGRGVPYPQPHLQ